MIGKFFGNYKIVKMIWEHSRAKNKNKLIRISFYIFGPLIIRLFGYPFSRRDRAKKIVKNMELKKNEKILDCGCGIGYYSFEFNIIYKCEVVGIDIDEEDIMLANSIIKVLNAKNIEFHVKSIDELDTGIFFDKILLSEVLEHIKNDYAIMQKLSTLLKPGGTIIITVPHSLNPIEFSEQQIKQSGIQGGHIRSGYNVESFSKILDKTNLTINKIDYCCNNKGLLLVLKNNVYL